jgi:SNF2 family DNA or RNA helicase
LAIRKKLASALADANVDLNPHQLDAVLFAFRSPLSKGCILADEVGLGKTIEAGWVIAQKGSEQKRRILIVTQPTCANNGPWKCRTNFICLPAF